MTVSKNLKVRVVGQDSKEMVFKLLPHTRMIRLKNIFADFVGLSVKQLKFFFKSTEVEDEDSADKLGMKDGDKISTVKEAGAHKDLPEGWKRVKHSLSPYPSLFVSPGGKIFNSLRAARLFLVCVGEEERSLELDQALAKVRRELESSWLKGELSKNAIKRRKSYQESSRYDFKNLRKKTLLFNAQRVRNEKTAAKTLFDARKNNKKFVWSGK